MEQIITLLVVDDHPLLREGILSLMKKTQDIQVSGVAGDGFEAVEKARELDPDVILIDLVLPGQDGIEAIHQIKQLNLHGHILVFSSKAEEDNLFLAIEAGASGYLSRGVEADDLLTTIREIHHSNGALHPSINRKLVEQYTRETAPRYPEPKGVLGKLTSREYEVLCLAATGLSNKEIAVKLKITNATVRSHISNTITKLKLVNRTQAILYALREGIVSLDSKATGMKPSGL